MSNSKTFYVQYTKAKDKLTGVILVRAESVEKALKNAKYCCFSGSDFRNATETDEKYSKPRKQGFAGRY